MDLYRTIKGVKEENLNSKFKLLRDHPDFRYAKTIVQDWTEGMNDRDGKMVREFQESFHSSFWEFYLYALFKDYGFEMDQSQSRPDFIITKPFQAYVEAVVSNIKTDGRREVTRGFEDVLSMIKSQLVLSDSNDVLIEAIVRHSNAFISKAKKYEEDYSKLDWIADDIPFVIALSAYDQVNYGREFLYPMMALLYGQYYDFRTHSYQVKKHVKKPGTSAKIPLGLFNSEKYKNISAVIFTCTVTLGKLTALSISHGYQKNNLVYALRNDIGTPGHPYKIQVVKPDVPEVLEDGVFVFHNPYAKNKLPSVYFEKDGRSHIVQFFVEQGKIIFNGIDTPIASRLDFHVEYMEVVNSLVSEFLELHK